MKAIVFEVAGDPAQVLAYTDIPGPKSDGQDVLVKVAARPIHPADMAFIRGLYRIKPSFPQAAGLEGAGVVVRSPGGSPFVPGMRVAFRCPGTWAEFAAVPADRLIAVPDGITDEVACQVSLNPLTAFGLLDEAAVSAGDWILLTAAASTVSNLVATIARARGIKVIGIVRGPVDAAQGRSGADHVLSIDDPNLIASVNALTGERRVASLLDSVGGPALPKLFGTLAAGARIIAYGVQDREPAAVTNAMLIYSNLAWKGFGIDRWLSLTPPDARARATAELWTLIRNRALQLPVASTHTLAEIQDALAADARPGRTGKVLLVA
jgi:NADPH2:quinone reductase